MASNLLKTLQNLENSRQKCIANAKTANLDTYPNMGFPEIANLFLKQNNNSPLSALPDWERPSDWWDTKTILANAEPRDGLYPAYIVLIDDYEDTTSFSKATTEHQKLQHDGILTSDGAWYTGADFIHTWDKTKDKECSLGYKTRYFIVYVTDAKAHNTAAIAPYLAYFRCLEVIWGNVNKMDVSFTVSSSGNFPSGSVYLLNFEMLDTCLADSIETYDMFSGCINLRNVYLPTIKNITKRSHFVNCGKLKRLEFPKVETITLEAGGNTFISNNHSLEEISFPKLKTISALSNHDAYVISGCYNLKKIYMPELDTCKGYIGMSCYGLKEIYIPKLKSITVIGSSSAALEVLEAPLLESATVGKGYLSLKEVYLPSLKTLGSSSFSNTYCLSKVELPSLTTISGSIFQTSTIEEFTFPETLTTFSGITSSFSNCPNLRKLNLFEGWKFSGLNLTSCRSLEKESIIDMLNKLADVTAESGTTYTLKLGAFNLGKLTAEEVAIGTNKGWTIS